MKIKRLTEDTVVARALGWLAYAVYKYRKLFFYPQVVLFGVCIYYTVANLEFDTVRSNLVGANKKYHQNFLSFKKEFPTQDDLVVVVESEDPDKNRQFVERLGARLEAETNVFRDVFYKGDLKMLGSKALLFVPEADLIELKKKLTDYKPFLQRFEHVTNLVSLFDMVNTQFRTAKQEQSSENQAMVNALPALERILKEASLSLRRLGNPPSPGVTALFSPGQNAEQQIYITFAKGMIYLVSAQAPDSSLNSQAVGRLRELVDETRLEVPGLNVGITGEPVLEHDEMAQSQKDTTLATIVSLIAVALIFIYGYQETGRPIKATLCLIVGLAYTLAFATFTVGHLNVLTITFVPILIGLAIDYGVHFISRFEEELRHGKSEQHALTKAMVYTGQGIFTGAFTTAGAFLAMGFTNFKGIQEMGVICGGGLLICLIPMLTMLPVMLLRGRQNIIDHLQGDLEERRARIENIWLQRPVLVSCITIGLSLLAATQVPKVYFDYDLLHMQSDGLPAVEFEKKLLNASEKSLLFGAVITTNLEQAIAAQAILTNLPAVASVQSITQFLSEDQTRKLGIVDEVKATLASLSFAQPDTAPVNLGELGATLYSLGGFIKTARGVVAREDPKLAGQFDSLYQVISDFRVFMMRGEPAQRQASALKLASFQQAFFKDLQQTFDAIKNQDTAAPLRAQDLPDALRHRFIGVTGKYLLMAYPRKDVWQRENQKEFIEQVSRVDPNVTGTPVQLYHYTELLKQSYESAAKYALMAIVVLVLFHFGSPLSVALALVPVGVGFLWLAAIMVYFNIPLNPANIMTLPLVIGIGVTNGIHILNRFAEEQSPNILARSTGKAVLISGLTTIAGFGSLILAKHQGIKSLGYVMSIGLTTCMIAGLTFLPALLNLMLRFRGDKKRPSDDNARIATGSGGTEV